MPQIVAGLSVLAAVLGLAAPGFTQSSEASSIQRREGLTVGAVANVALEGSGPWFAPGVRLGVPVGARIRLDVESSAVFGGKLPAPYGSITSFLAMNVRHLRAPRAADGTSRYWIYGLRYTPIAWPAGEPHRHNHDLAVTIGMGWDQVFRKGGRVGGEVGFSGGNGFLFFTTIVLAFPVFR